MNRKVFRLEHKRKLIRQKKAMHDVKLLGYYVEKEDVEKVIEQYSSIVGFCDYPDGFVITEMEVDGNDDMSNWEFSISL